ncbi:histidine phosphatase family protein [Jatrophihabitans fulvus]
MSSGPPRWFPPNEQATRVFMVRHGSTEHSLSGRFSGRNDLPLDERGRGQARAIAHHIAGLGGIDAIVSSPLRRARETAAAIAARTGAVVDVHDDLIESEFGEWEGLSIDEVHVAWPELLATWLDGADVAPPKGESFAQVESRTLRGLREIVDARRGQTIVLVSHVTPIKTLLRLALGSPQETMFRFHLDTASLSIVDYYDDGTSSVRTINNAEHPDPGPL